MARSTLTRSTCVITENLHCFKNGCFFYQKIRDRGLDKGQSRSKRFEQKDVLPSVSKRPADMSCDTKSSFSSKLPQIQADFPLTIHIKTRMVELTLLLPKTPPPSPPPSLTLSLSLPLSLSLYLYFY